MSGFAENKNILVFGDSLSAGYGLARGLEWPHLMQQRLNALKLPYTIENHSISGETTSGGLSRFKNSLQQARPSIVILELGANDGLQGLSLKIMRSQLQTMINIAHEQNITIILVGMHLPSNYGEAYTQQFHKAFTELAEQNNTPYIPFLMQGLSIGLEMYQADGLHPTAKAQPIIMETVWQTLKTVIAPEK